MRHVTWLCAWTIALVGLAAGAYAQGEAGHEVWLVDQSNSTPLTYGGKVYIYDGAKLAGRGAATALLDVIDLAGGTAALCFASTGANPVRPHMLFFNTEHTHAILSFVTSGHVVIFDAAARVPVSCVRTSVGAGGARQAHAASPSPDGTYILVANQNGKLLERIDTNYSTNTFALNAAATLDLATCVTPNAIACQLAGVRPDNAPICPLVDSSSNLGFVTLRGGGLFVVNPKVTPMAIEGEYDMATVHPNGCGGNEAAGRIFINSGGGTAANLAEFDVYAFPLSGYSAANPPNTPAPTLIFSDDVGDRDSHGTTVTRGGRYLWVGDRHDNVVEVFDTGSGARVNTFSLHGPLSADAAPDLMDIAPAGNRVYTSLRGPNPLSGDPHSATGSTPVWALSASTRQGGMVCSRTSFASSMSMRPASKGPMPTVYVSDARACPRNPQLL